LGVLSHTFIFELFLSIFKQPMQCAVP